METEDCPDQNQDFQHNYDDEHDSDVEARLYAEVYYSNTIIGEENETNGSLLKNQCPATLDDLKKSNSNNQNLVNGKSVTQQDSTRDVCDSNPAASNDSSYNAINKTKSATRDSNCQSTNSLSNGVASSQVITNTPNTKKRTSDGCLGEVNQPSKKRKHENHNSVAELQARQSNGLSNEMPPNQQNNVTFQNDSRTLVNPYNKSVMSNGQTNLKLLSPEVINLFFAGKSRKKKKKEYPAKQDKSKKTTAQTQRPTVIITQESSSAKPAESQLQNGFSNKSTVIDISSESSNESFENVSKYNTIVATEKKLRKRESDFKRTSKPGESDSEESIFEVPVPPKPAPPLIEVNDTDNERENQKNSDNDSDNDSFLDDSFNSQTSDFQKSHEISLNSTANETCEIISDSDDSNGLILNCTGVQKGVSSLSEIKKMNQKTSSPNQRNSSVNIQHHEEKSKSCNNSPVIEKSSTSLKSNQTPKTCSRDISAAEYFFQPMNEKMMSFYNNSWGGENFDMNQIKSNMSTDPNKWAILNRDLAITGPRKKRYFGMTCSRCHNEGHRQSECPEPNKGPTCHMCGASGHYATYCPHTKCLTCGRKQTMYRTTCGYCEKLFCSRCRSQGHRDDACPDLWRRYHHTTNSPTPKIPRNVNNVMKSRHELVCCNCTKQGHDSLACRKLRWSQHFANPSFVTHYNGPAYNVDTDFDPPIIVDDVHESSYNVHNKRNNSSGCDNSFSNAMTFNTVTNNIPRLDRRNEDSIQDRGDRASSSLEPGGNVIFNIRRMKSKYNAETQTIKSSTLKLNVPDKSNLNSIEKWKKLSDFLKELTSEMSAEYRLERKDKQFFMYVKCSRKYTECLSLLIKQYASRNEFERSQMLLDGNRKLKVIVEHLSRKFSEMKSLKEDILTLHQETMRLREELFDKEGRVQNESQNRMKLNELALSQQKLLMLLYREGFGDESLGQLRKAFLKMENLIANSSVRRKAKKFTSPILKISFKLLFTYLYYYNNIFVPYASSKLDSYIQKYKDNRDTRNRLLNSSLLFPQGTNNQDKHDSHKASVQDSTSQEKVAPEDSPKPLASTSEEPWWLQDSVTEESADTTNDSFDIPKPTASSSKQNHLNPEPLQLTTASPKQNHLNSKSLESTTASPKQNHLNSKSSESTSTSSKQNSNRNLNTLYLQALKATNVKRKENLMKNFRNFLKNARNCLEKASKLNSPRLLDDIRNLQRDLEDETHLSVNKVRKFKKKFREETLRLQGVTKTKKSKKEVQKDLQKSIADNRYKKFCASL